MSHKTVVADQSESDVMLSLSVCEVGRSTFMPGVDNFFIRRAVCGKSKSFPGRIITFFSLDFGG